MLIQIPDVLTPEQVAHARCLLDSADWLDGRITAGHQASLVKDNAQLPEQHPVGRELGDIIISSLQKNALFVSAALPLRAVAQLSLRRARVSRAQPRREERARLAGLRGRPGGLAGPSSRSRVVRSRELGLSRDVRAGGTFRGFDSRRLHFPARHFREPS